MSRKPNPVLPRWLRDFTERGLYPLAHSLGIAAVMVAPMLIMVAGFYWLEGQHPAPDPAWSAVIDSQQRAHNEFGKYLDGRALAMHGFGHLPDGVAVKTNEAGSCFIATGTRGAHTWLMNSRTHEWVPTDTAQPSTYQWCLPDIGVLLN